MKDDELEVLDFDDKASLEDVEVIDVDDIVLNSIDEAFDAAFPEEKKQIKSDEILSKINSKKLDTYAPSIKNFNIKSAKTHKIVKKVMIYTIIFILFTFEFFLNKAESTLTDIRVYATNNNPIIISKNNKYGFMDYTGEVLVNPKYSYAEEFVNGYAIVRDATNLALVIDKGGKEVIKTGEYFNITRAGYNLIVSKATEDGLKYGILRSDLKKLVDYKYDMLIYENGVYKYYKGNYVGILNNKYKEVYKYKLNDSDNKDVAITPSVITNSNKIEYAVMTINSSSVIIDVQNGKVLTSPTLNSIVAQKNNVFYEEKGNNSKEFYYVYNDKVVIDSIDYNTLEMPSLSAGVLKAFKKDYSYEVILGANGNSFEELAVSDTYFGDDIFIYKTYNLEDNSVVYKLISGDEEINTLENIKGIKSGYKNGCAIIVNNDNTYSYIDSKGELLNDEHYTYVSNFDKYGDAIVGIKGKYGVINKKGKKVLDVKYKIIKKASETYKINTMSDSNTVFYAAKENNYFKLFDKKGKKVNDNNYSKVLFDDNYGFVKLSSSDGDEILVTATLSSIKVPSFTTAYEAHSNYVVIKNKYYSRRGKVIYTIPKNN